MSQPHNTQYTEKPMTTYGRTQGPSRRYRRLRHPIFLSTEWTAKNPLLQRGEIGAESDTHRLKIGDGVTYWNDLPYTSDSVATWGAINGNIADQTDLKNALDGKVSTDGSSTMTGVLKMRASISFECAIAPYWHGVGLYQLNDNDSVILLASMETPDGWCPGTNNTFNMGSTSKKWKNLYLSGSAYVSKINNGFDIAVPVTNSADEFALKSQVDLKANIADLATVATTGSYTDLLNKPTLGTAAAANTTDFATAAQGTLADTALQPGDDVSDLNNDAGYQTAGDVATAISGKQDTLTAGTNITITGTTISATDTTYSNFTGASAGDAGASGLVPAPAAGDQAKFLQGDGTWTTPTAATAWGSITGTLSDQTDLQSALDAKLDADKAYYPDLFDWKWADHEISDMSWLRADTFSWQDGTVYSDAYDHLADDISGKTLQTETVGGTTISFYLADDGHKICPATQESNVTAIYTATGVAWYYILDTDNTRFKLPRTQFGVTGLRDTVGKYVAPGLPNITGTITQSDCAAGTYNANRTGAFRAINTSSSRGYMFDRLVATNNIGDIGFNAGWSNSIYGNGTTVQPPATQQYLYFYVGEFGQTAVEQTAGLNASLFNNKVDIGHQVVAFQEPNAGNNYTWYRKYADGWVEQGGIFTATVSSGNSNNNCNFPITMKDTHYAASVGGGFISGTAFMKWNVVGKNTTYVTISGDTGNVALSGYTTTECSWQVSGMAA